MLRPIVQLTVVIALFAFAWKLERAESKSRRRGTDNPEAPWPSSRGALSDETIKDRLPSDGWFTLTDLARAVQGAPAWRKPSGSAGRDARTVIERWVRERRVESTRFGPSERCFYRFV